MVLGGLPAGAQDVVQGSPERGGLEVGEDEPALLLAKPLLDREDGPPHGHPGPVRHLHLDWTLPGGGLLGDGQGGPRQGQDGQEAQAKEQAFQAYVQKAAAGSGGGTVDELSKLAELKAQGVITDAEFEQQKSKLLA